MLNYVYMPDHHGDGMVGTLLQLIFWIMIKLDYGIYGGRIEEDYKATHVSG